MGVPEREASKLTRDKAQLNAAAFQMASHSSAKGAERGSARKEQRAPMQSGDENAVNAGQIGLIL